MLDAIRQEKSAMEAAIPTWEWDSKYDEIHSRLSREGFNILFGGEKE